MALTVKLASDLVKTYFQTVRFKVVPSPLVALIEGGDRMLGYNSPFEL